MQNHSRYRRSSGARKSSFVGTVIRRFHTENMAQTSAALAFTTLLALVPLGTLIVSVASTLPLFNTLISRLDAVLMQSLLPTGSAGVISSYMGKFTGKASSLTVPVIAVLGLTAFLLMHTIERTFNHLWLVKPRPFLSRLKLYAFVMVVWPFLLGAVAAAMSFGVTVSLGFLDDPSRLRGFLLKGVSMMLLGLFFAFLYYAVPNAPVKRRAAAVGGAFAAVVFTLMQKGFEWYLSSFGVLKTVYGAFSAVPIFLIWLQLSWSVILIGGLLTATAFRPARR